MIEKLLRGEYPIYAHKKGEKENLQYESLQDHSHLAQQYYHRILEEKDLRPIFKRLLSGLIPTGDNIEPYRKPFFEFLEAMVLLHDIGKINPLFQRGKMGNVAVNSSGYEGVDNTEHSFLSSVLYIDQCLYLLKQYEWLEDKDYDPEVVQRFLQGIIVINAYLISRHHSDLEELDQYIKEFLELGKAYDIVEGLKEREDSHYIGLQFFHARINTNFLASSYENLLKIINKNEPALLYTYSRLAYSVLAAADYYSTTEFMSGTAISDFGNIMGLHDFVETYEATPLLRNIRNSGAGTDDSNPSLQSPINILRTKMFLEAEQTLQANLSENIFFLEAPTGGGKSNIAVNLSFKLAEQNRGKIYYIYPFNTLIEQNIESLKKIFGHRDDIMNQVSVVNSVTEIKSNGRDADYDSDINYTKMLLDRQFMNYPFVLMTHVSLFDILFGHSRSALFSFLQLTNSVVVLDEIQSYRIEIWAEIINLLKCYAKYLNIKIVIMSATLPNLDLLTNTSNSVRLLPNPDEYFQDPLFRSRVTISYELLDQGTSQEELIEHILGQDPSKKILIELIKKSDARDLHQKLVRKEDLNKEVFCLTGDHNVLDRKRILDKIKECQKGVILVATQVIEAGVDIDMDIGYKNISKLDSEEQFLGRINRSAKRNGMVYLFELTTPQKIYTDDLRIDTKNQVKNAENRKMLFDKDFERYYLQIINQLKEKRVNSSTENGLEYFLMKEVLLCKYKDISQKMKLICDKYRRQSYFFNRVIKTLDGEIIDGFIIWEEYKALLLNQSLDYAERVIRLSRVRTKLQYFVYEFSKNIKLEINDMIGELAYIENGEDYFVNDELDYEQIDPHDERLFL